MIMIVEERLKLDDIISEEERSHLLSELHRFLVWVGEPLPDAVEVNGETIKLHELIWRCIHKKEFSEKEKAHFMELVRLLETKEKHDEEILQKANLTKEDAKRLYHDTAALIRAIMDIRECEAGRVELRESREDVRKKIEDAKRWLGFLKGIGKKVS